MSHTVVPRPGAETEAWARSALGVLCDVPAVRRVGLALVEGGGRRLSFTASDRGDPGDAGWCEVDAYDDVPLNNTIRTGKLITGSLQELAGRYAEFVARQEASTRALAAVPFVAAGQVMGGFVLFFDADQPFGRSQQHELTRLGEALGTELGRGRRARALRPRSSAEERVPEGAQVAVHVVAAEPRAVATARRFVQDTLTGWGVDADSRADAVLCVSELVTNAIIHTIAGCEVRLVLRRGVLALSVRDAGTDSPGPSSPTVDPFAAHGRGLRLVELTATRWGSEVDGDGMTVWLELHLP